MIVRRITVVATLVLVSACSPSPRDVVPETRDVRVTPDAGTNPNDTYTHVARRAHGVVALAEARHMSDGDAKEMVEHIADDLERCATNLEAQRLLVDGAARIVAIAAGPNGTPVLNVRFAPGDAVAQNALLCLVAPMRAMTFPSSSTATPDKTPGMAIEATWGPRGSNSTLENREIRDSGGPL